MGNAGVISRGAGGCLQIGKFIVPDDLDSLLRIYRVRCTLSFDFRSLSRVLGGAITAVPRREISTPTLVLNLLRSKPTYSL